LARNSQAKIYRIRQPVGRVNHTTERDIRLCSPTYRGWRIVCIGDEIPALQRAIDDYWNKLYAEADGPAAKVAVLMQERALRAEPKEWRGP
jgi:hypothetical protein